MKPAGPAPAIRPLRLLAAPGFFRGSTLGAIDHGLEAHDELFALEHDIAGPHHIEPPTKGGTP